MKEITIWDPAEYAYPLAFGFIPHMRPYMLEDGRVHPCMLIAPGGGYAFVSPSEGELVANAFNDLGYQCFVLTYTTNILMKAPLLDQPIKDMARAIRYLRANADRFRIDPSRLYVCGFSASGHLTATICDYFDEIPDENPLYADISCRPDAAILSYPVITSGGHAHQGSFRCLLGADIYEQGTPESLALLDRFSLERHVNENTPPCFLWQTMTDESVPVENSYLYEAALREKGIPHAHHVFSRGRHGSSVANTAWAHCLFGEHYTMDQNERLLAAVRDGSFPVTPDELAFLEELIEHHYDNRKDAPYPEVTPWPLLADLFLKTL